VQRAMFAFNMQLAHVNSTSQLSSHSVNLLRNDSTKLVW